MTSPSTDTTMATAPRTTSTWRSKIGFGIALVVLVAAAATLLPAIRINHCAQTVIMGNDARQFVMSVLALANENGRWPTSLEDYRQQCQKAQVEVPPPKSDRRIFVAWDQFARAEREQHALPVCIMFDGKRAAVGFSDGHYEYPSPAHIEKILAAGLAAW